LFITYLTDELVILGDNTQYHPAHRSQPTRLDWPILLSQGHLPLTWATRRLQAAEHYTSLAAQPPAYRQRLQRGRLARLDQRQQLVKARGVTRTLKPGACRLGGLVPPRER
jgi:hypothetical protein